MMEVALSNGHLANGGLADYEMGGATPAAADSGVRFGTGLILPPPEIKGACLAVRACAYSCAYVLHPRLQT